LVQQALSANPDLESARDALRISQELARAQGATFWPTVVANYTPSRQRVAAVSTSPLSSNATVFNLHTAQVSVSYFPDVFGGIRRAFESAQAQAQAQRFQMEAAYLSLTSNVVVGAIQLASLRAQLEAAEQSVGSASGQLQILQRQLALGQVAEAAVMAQQAALAQAQAALPGLRKQLQQQANVLATLDGRLVAQDAPPPLELSDLKLPGELPVSLPSRLVEQRPDVQAARAQLHAACADVGVAIANELPQFTLTASGGAMATRLADLGRADNVFWNLAANAAQPIFEGGALIHRRRAAQAAYEQAVARYRSTVLSAFQNVADVLEAVQADADAMVAATEAERLAQASLQIAQRQLELGDVNPLQVLEADQALQQARSNRVQAQANRLADSAALFQALGGGWWNR
jgi:NodT family efflux transporter outer membrane factor (OMF) lipoprotein